MLSNTVIVLALTTLMIVTSEFTPAVCNEVGSSNANAASAANSPKQAGAPAASSATRAIDTTRTSLLAADPTKQGRANDATKQNSTGDAAKQNTTSDAAKQNTTGDAAKQNTTSDAAKQNTTGDAAKRDTTSDAAKQNTTGDAAKQGTTGDAAKQGTTGDAAKQGTTDDATTQSPTGEATKQGTTGDTAPATMPLTPNTSVDPSNPAGARTNETVKAAASQLTKPLEPRPPKGFDAALQLYKTGKYSTAASQFQKFIKEGVADTNTHFYLAYCLYYQRLYSKALKEFDWVAKNGKGSLSQIRSAEATARALQNSMAGICPGDCLKATDPRWRHDKVAGHPDTDVWIRFPYKDGTGGWHEWSQHHIGDVIVYEKGAAVNKGKCKICGGTTRVKPLRDGAALR